MNSRNKHEHLIIKYNFKIFPKIWGSNGASHPEILTSKVKLVHRSDSILKITIHRNGIIYPYDPDLRILNKTLLMSNLVGVYIIFQNFIGRGKILHKTELVTL